MNDCKKMRSVSNQKTVDEFAIKPEAIMDNVKPISYKDCADAMMKMWMERVLTDGEYNRIMDKLNKAHKERKI